MKKVTLYHGALLITILIILFSIVLLRTTPSKEVGALPVTQEIITKDDMIRVNPFVTEGLKSPVTITGEARGMWYFEGSFPVELRDENDTLITTGIAQAQSEWMTENYVPFSVTLTFAKPKSLGGTIVFKKDNPSGDASLDNALSVPITFHQEVKEVSLFYYDASKDQDADGNILCSEKGLVAVKRTIPLTQTPLEDTLLVLLYGGITQQEEEMGLSTDFPLEGLSLSSVNLKPSGELIIALKDPENRTGGGSCITAIRRAQIEKTAKQFEAVKTVTFSPKTLFQP